MKGSQEVYGVITEEVSPIQNSDVQGVMKCGCITGSFLHVNGFVYSFKGKVLPSRVWIILLCSWQCLVLCLADIRWWINKYLPYLNILHGNICHLGNDIMWCRKRKPDTNHQAFAVSLICVHHCRVLWTSHTKPKTSSVLLRNLKGRLVTC